ncbi:TPA: hypothetical protein ACPEYD_001721 [Klebsiella pneumoniae]|uniref:hypothetical protein n=1 Tax=Klebsiella pneumoniae complex TaxID=3390273 RepID=UPI000B633675|nr:hypothetical protein [Klebsiella variicola]EKV4533392.1 hypothetical protein [Klebsiella pneumoniae]EKV6725136.1 hypothetical protein [Raoultella ornithinolytica]ELA2799590.1 hypothetical protein [Klebsiella pneumoniae]OVE63195.1 hypothetical protein SQ56_00745 [Klebsiella variicola]HBS3547966.1 hypothetical protein [Klebsiella pneumoniae]
MFIKIIINIIASCVLTYILNKYISPMAHTDILSTAGVLSTVAGILFGFVLAAISIFSSASSSPDGIIFALKQTKILPKIILNLLTTGATLILACVFPLIAMFVSDKIIIHTLRVDFLLTLFGFSILILSIISFISTWRKINWILPHI